MAAPHQAASVEDIAGKASRGEKAAISTRSGNLLATDSSLMNAPAGEPRPHVTSPSSGR